MHASRSIALAAVATISAASTALAADPARDFQGRFPAEAISRYDLEIPAGDVQIRADEKIGMVTIDAVPVNWPEGCAVDIGQDAERAWTRVDHNTPMRSCRLDVAVTLGVGTVVMVRVGQGNVKVTNLAGALTADIGAGDLLLESMSGAFDAEVGNGQIEGTFTGPRLRAEVGSGGVHLAELVSPASVEIGLGNVDLIYREAPAGRIDARTGTGSIKILLPPETPIRADVMLGIGSKRVNLPVTEDAPTEIEATVGLGRVLIAATAEEDDSEDDADLDE